jgi:hypothetical protein
MTAQSAIRELEPQFYEILGRIAVRWGFIEAILVEFLACLSEIDPGLLTILTEKLNNATVVDWTRSVVKLRFEWQGKEDDLADELLALLARIDALRAERNKFIHGAWTTDTEAGTVMIQTVRWSRDAVVSNELVTLADLNDFHDDLGEVADALIRIGQATGFLKPRDELGA